MSRSARCLALLGLLVASAYGGGGEGGNSNPTSPGANPTAGDGNISITVNGTAWRSSKSTDHVTRSATFVGISSFNVPYALVLGIGNPVVGTTYSLYLAAGGNGSSAIVSTTTGGWGTAFSGGTGTITLTVLTANRVAGTFSFDAVPGSGSASGTVQVRNGTFDLTY